MAVTAWHTLSHDGASFLKERGHNPSVLAVVTAIDLLNFVAAREREQKRLGST